MYVLKITTKNVLFKTNCRSYYNNITSLLLSFYGQDLINKTFPKKNPFFLSPFKEGAMIQRTVIKS